MNYKIKPIKTEKDYDEALCRVEYLMDRSDQNDVLNELEVISILIEQYEKR